MSIITIAAVTSAQIATENGSIWACGPIAIIAVMEAMRIPLSGWAAHLRPLAMFGAFVVMAAISVLTFEGMSVAVERFMHQRVIEVVKAHKVLDAAQQRKDDEATAEALYTKRLAELNVEGEKRRDALVKLKAEQPNLVALPPPGTCTGHKRGKKGVLIPFSYRCQDPTSQTTANSNAAAQKAHDDEIRKAAESVAEVEAQAKALPKPEHAKETETAIANAKKALDDAAEDSTMYRTAATWFGTAAKDLSVDQFETFKRYAVFGVAAAMAVVTMLVSFLSHAVPRERNGSKVGRAIRAYFARKRKAVVRTVFKTVEKPVEKVVEVEKHVIVDRPTVVEKRVEVPGPERIVTKHVHVPVDINTWRVVNRDGTLSEESVSPLHVVQGGKP